MSDPVRASSFGGVAADYDRFRPASPPEAVAWVLAGAAPETTRLPVVELGAGTGLFTRRLLDQGRPVVATEPDARMLAVLTARSSEAAAVRATAEHLPLQGATAGAVAVSSAWHWMDPEATTAEVARVLRSGGVFGIVGNGPDRSVPWVATLFETSRQGPATTADDEGSAPARSPARSPATSPAPASRRPVRLPEEAPFGPPETTEVTWSLPVTRDHLVGMVGTYSRVIVLDEQGRGDHLAAVERRLDDVVGELEAAGWRLPQRCRCWRAVRR